jgi:protein TonB
MAQAAFLQPSKGNSTVLAGVILLHGAAITALALAKMDVIKVPTFTETEVFEVKEIPPDEPQPPVEKTVEPRVAPPVTMPPPVVQLPPLPQAPIAEQTQIKPVEFTTRADPVVAPDPGPAVTPPPPEAKTVKPARAKANLGSYVSDDDYPSSAIRGEEQGTTRFRLTIGPDGRVTDCAVTGSSGSTALDTTTCRLMQRRARFTPARDSSGAPVGDVVSNSIRWVLPD